MTRRIGKRTREAAIHCLEQCASDRIGGVSDTYTWHVCDDGSPEENAAGSAYAAVSGIIWDRLGYTPMICKYLEAAALLRDGWNPGDPVEVRR